MKAGDVVFVRGQSWISKIIKRFDEGDFSHVAIFVSDHEILEAEYSTKVGVKEFAYKDYEIIRMGLSDLQKAKINFIARKYEGTTYDFKNIFLLWFSLLFGIDYFRKFNNPKQVICSELVGYCLYSVGIKNENLPNMTPNELYKYLKEG